jgi:AcrR family transcriptional regulator
MVKPPTGAVTPRAGARAPQQIRSRQSFQRILETAERLLIEKGIDDFTMNAVAERSGVSIGGIYRRFEGRESLLLAVKDEMLTRLTARVSKEIGTAKSLHDAVRTYTYTLAEEFSDNARLLKFLLMELAGDSEASARGRRALADLRDEFVATGMRHTQDLAQPATERLPFACQVITSTLLHASILELSQPDRQSRHAKRRALADNLCQMTVAYLLEPSPAARKTRSVRPAATGKT